MDLKLLGSDDPATLFCQESGTADMYHYMGPLNSYINHLAFDKLMTE